MSSSISEDSLYHLNQVKELIISIQSMLNKSKILTPSSPPFHVYIYLKMQPKSNASALDFWVEIYHVGARFSELSEIKQNLGVS